MSRLTEGWLDEFGFRHVPNPRSGGSTYDPEGEGYPYRIVLHTTETDQMPNTAAHAYPPQVWARYESGELIQTIPVTRAGFALYQAAWSPYYTNRARALQIEFVGRAIQAGSWPDDKLRWIAERVMLPLCRYVEAVGARIDLSDPFVPEPGAIPGSAYPDAPQRLTPATWAFGTGLCGHRHVPMGDDHWDAGAANMRRIRDFLVAALGGSGFPAPVPTEPTRRILDVPEGKLRRNPADDTPLVFPWEGFPLGVVALDFTLVPVGATIGVGFDPAYGVPAAHRVNAAATANGADIADRVALGPGAPGLFPIKGTREVAVLVHADEHVLPQSERRPGGRARVNAVAV